MSAASSIPYASTVRSGGINLPNVIILEGVVDCAICVDRLVIFVLVARSSRGHVRSVAHFYFPMQFRMVFFRIAMNLDI